MLFLEKNGNQFPLENFPKGAALLVDKPLGWTSFDVVNKIRWHLSQRLQSKKIKIGHAGTLDPLATGLLILCIGEYTKRIESLQGLPKTYSGSITFGATTPSFDLEKAPDQFFPVEHLTDDLIQKTVAEKFMGEILQIPPMFSAIKVDGKRVYKNARTGEQVELEPRRLTIEKFEVSPLREVQVLENQVVQLNKKGTQIFLHPDFSGGRQLDFRVVCSKGTYIRSLANDLGEAVGSGAYLSALRREATGDFSVSAAWAVAEVVDWITIGTRIGQI